MLRFPMSHCLKGKRDYKRLLRVSVIRDGGENSVKENDELQEEVHEGVHEGNAAYP